MCLVSRALKKKRLSITIHSAGALTARHMTNIQLLKNSSRSKTGALNKNIMLLTKTGRNLKMEKKIIWPIFKEKVFGTQLCKQNSILVFQTRATTRKQNRLKNQQAQSLCNSEREREIILVVYWLSGLYAASRRLMYVTHLPATLAKWP